MLHIMNHSQSQKYLCIPIFLVLCTFTLATVSWGGVDRVFTENNAKAYCQQSKNRKGVNAKTQNQCCAAVTKQCHESCSKQKDGRIACSGGCNAAFESCWDKKEKPGKFNAKWMYSYCKKRNRNVAEHNLCCNRMSLDCGAACDYKYPQSQRGACMKRCEKAEGSCFRTAKPVKKKPFNPLWMNEYCSDSKKRKKVKAANREVCCQIMHERCDNACDGYKPNEREACRDRCGQAINQCG